MNESLSQTKPIRLHLGCADVRLPDYLNMDVRNTVATDLVGDAWDLHEFKDGSVASIYTRHMIEHLEPDDATRSFREWARVLSAGGHAHIICPDLVFHAKQYLGMAISTITNDQHFHAMAGFYGWKVESRGGSRYDAHRWGYSFETLSAALKHAGFSRVERVLQGKDSEPWHLNVMAYKG
ncbi:MAG TPA: methyltransferase domain-containing protein [Bosea sp. (in: a-proteobacteria)]|jgi:ubiquinone/menaquinone biosynthesis C-methylase UbiE|nr:methyltransferase domain-containing protein [Bosea sp. (in: a-proteobacteria)]